MNRVSMKRPANQAQQVIERMFCRDGAPEFVDYETGKMIFIPELGRVRFYKSDGVTLLFEVNETTGVFVSGVKIPVVIMGDGVFNSTSGTLIDFGVTVPDKEYFVDIMPEGNAGGLIGDVTVTRISESEFKVECSGEPGAQAFRWKVTY